MTNVSGQYRKRVCNPGSEQVDKVFVAFYDKMSLNAVVNREHLMRSWVGNGAVTTFPWIGPEHYDDYQLLTQLDYKLINCSF